MATQSVCGFYKFGFCRFREVCRKEHVKKLCESSSCDGKTCAERHPRVCKFFKNVGYCKFGEWCLFSHIIKKDPEMEKLKAENRAILKRLEEVEKVLFEKDKEINDIMKSIEETRKMETNKPEKCFKCTKCSFETNSQSGLKIHSKKKHTEVIKETYPKICELCDENLENADKLRKHMKRHSYKKAKFKCEDCEFVGECEATMEVHIGKDHSVNFECGICDLVVNTLENLEIHLFSCEVYQCDMCKSKFKSISQFKKHIPEMKCMEAGGYQYVHHLKMERHKPNEVSDNLHCSDKL